MVPALKFYKFIYEQIPIRLSNELVVLYRAYRFTVSLLLLTPLPEG